MYLTVKQQVKQFSKEDYRNIKELSHIAKNLANQAIYNVRQYYFREGKYLNYQKNYVLLKESENYKALNSNMAQQIMKEVDGMFQSFFALLELAKKGKYSFKAVKLPKYLPKDGFTTLIIGFVRLKGNQLTIPYSQSYAKEHKKVTINIPPILEGKKVKEIRIIPKSKARFFEIQYAYEAVEEQRELDEQKALAIDFGIDNLTTCVTNEGQTFIIDGRRLKSINQWYNKENSRLQSIKDKQKFGKKCTNRQNNLAYKRNNRVNDYMSKTARKIINYCLDKSIGVLVCGYNVTFQRNSNIGKVSNQNFVNIPFGKLRDKLQYLCERYGMKYIEQEESYTSKASFLDLDEIPIYNADNPKKYEFNGKRITRGLYQSSDGRIVNADINGAANILRKSSQNFDFGELGRGLLASPLRIRLP